MMLGPQLDGRYVLELIGFSLSLLCFGKVMKELQGDVDVAFSVIIMERQMLVKKQKRMLKVLRG
jgi:hypothetical protein